MILTLQTSLHKAFLMVAVLVVPFLVGCSSSSSLRSAPSKRAVQILERAESLIGTSYCPAGRTPECFDCSGFVLYCYFIDDAVLPLTSHSMYVEGSPVDKGAPLPGDLVFFRTIGNDVNHVGIMMDANRFIHASSSNGVMVSSLTDTYWSSRYIGARRYIR
ncbi:MAG: C40 family peptidase [Candidatus Kapabacteria bacterium]|nr:C40 family peptidase [Candidatus Kapabacteria bacterium]